jgi:hypothetical protein
MKEKYQSVLKEEKIKAPELRKPVHEVGDKINALLKVVKANHEISKNKELMHHIEELEGHYWNILTLLNKNYLWD